MPYSFHTLMTPCLNLLRCCLGCAVQLEVHVGSEVQGRPVRTYPEVGLPEVQHQAMLDKTEEVRDERRGGGSASVEGMGLRGLSAHMQMRVEGSSRRKKPNPVDAWLSRSCGRSPSGTRRGRLRAAWWCASRRRCCAAAGWSTASSGPMQVSVTLVSVPPHRHYNWHGTSAECPNLSHTLVVSDSELECVTLLSSQREPSSVTARSSVSHSILQWAAKVGVTSGHGCAVAASGAEG